MKIKKREGRELINRNAGSGISGRGPSIRGGWGSRSRIRRYRRERRRRNGGRRSIRRGGRSGNRGSISRRRGGGMNRSRSIS